MAGKLVGNRTEHPIERLKYVSGVSAVENKVGTRDMGDRLERLNNRGADGTKWRIELGYSTHHRTVLPLPAKVYISDQVHLNRQRLISSPFPANQRNEFASVCHRAKSGPSRNHFPVSARCLPSAASN